MASTDPADLPPESTWNFDGMVDAFRAAGKRIHRDRRRMSLEDAEDIVRMEGRKRGVRIPEEHVAQIALGAHSGPLQRLVRILRARREYPHNN